MLLPYCAFLTWHEKHEKAIAIQESIRLRVAFFAGWRARAEASGEAPKPETAEAEYAVPTDWHAEATLWRDLAERIVEDQSQFMDDLEASRRSSV